MASWLGWKTWMFGEKARYGELSRTPGEPDTGNGIGGALQHGVSLLFLTYITCFQHTNLSRDSNTCYLNSSRQCLSHTPIFRDYFTSKVYLNDINATNPLGHQGKLAQVTAVLINSMWKRFNQTAQPTPQKRITAPGSYAPVSAPALTPKTFKESLGKFNDHFAGNEQHDAQELLAFLLGGLSEI
jgi:ubiquitin C-terminal hydrolase